MRAAGISAAPRLHLDCISAVPRLCPSTVPRLCASPVCLGCTCTSTVPQLSLGCPSAVPRRHLGGISAHLGDVSLLQLHAVLLGLLLPGDGDGRRAHRMHLQEMITGAISGTCRDDVVGTMSGRGRVKAVSETCQSGVGDVSKRCRGRVRAVSGTMPGRCPRDASGTRRCEVSGDWIEEPGWLCERALSYRWVSCESACLSRVHPYRVGVQSEPLAALRPSTTYRTVVVMRWAFFRVTVLTTETIA